MKLVSILSFTLLKTFAYASLSGSASITPNDYIGLPPIGLKNNPPACEMPYATLDLSRIVAVQALNKATDCNKCLKIVNSGNGKYVYALAVDMGGQGLDLSTPSFKALFGQQWDASPATWSETDYANCKGIYDPKGHPTIVEPVAISGSNKNHRPVSKPPTKPTKTKSAILVPTAKTTPYPKKSPSSKAPRKPKPTPSSGSKKKKKTTLPSKNKKPNNKKSQDKKKKSQHKKCTRCQVGHQKHHRHLRYKYI
ncbi:hypothetical protein BJ944DRAFT_258710 [Cunninghamella echinulata]|nr:hypothetical protein BJ944DRAFT_258710 [Cunninghamella echinulata]